jgi:hypothetical protein
MSRRLTTVLPGFHLLPVSLIVRVNRPLQDSPWNFGPLSAVCVGSRQPMVMRADPNRKAIGTEPPRCSGVLGRASAMVHPPRVRCEARQTGIGPFPQWETTCKWMSCIGGTHKDHQVCKRRAGSGPRRALTFTRRQAGRPASPVSQRNSSCSSTRRWPDAGPDEPAISAAAGRPPRGMRSGAHRARADERNAGTRLFIQSKVSLGRLSAIQWPVICGWYKIRRDLDSRGTCKNA